MKISFIAKLKSFYSVNRTNLIIATIVTSSIVVVGLILLAVHAATSVVAHEAESGTKSANVTTVADTTASGGSAIKFTAPTAPPPPPPPGNWTRPTAATTGPKGTLTAWTGSTTFTANNQTISNVDFGGYIAVTGSNLVLDNCRFVGMAFYGPGPLTIKNCLSDGGNINIDAYFRAINNVTFDHVHVICADHDGIDLFSSASYRESNISILDTLVDGESFPSTSTAHGDGLQVRGISGLTVQRSVVDMYTVGGVQPQKNSAIYFENVNGGDDGMHFTDIDIYGGDPYNHTYYTNAVTNSTAVNLAIRRGGYVTRATPSGWAFTNVTGPSGTPISP